MSWVGPHLAPTSTSINGHACRYTHLERDGSPAVTSCIGHLSVFPHSLPITICSSWKALSTLTCKQTLWGFKNKDTQTIPTNVLFLRLRKLWLASENPDSPSPPHLVGWYHISFLTLRKSNEMEKKVCVGGRGGGGKWM